MKIITCFHYMIWNSAFRIKLFKITYNPPFFDKNSIEIQPDVNLPFTSSSLILKTNRNLNKLSIQEGIRIVMLNY
ncbi:protein of unknown function [Paenibacillus alvei]|uniref:Uncharacterized protein n=1 Tax=Paenibacillus alvei TaxID=44250 RepID=A0A383R604_PAEAL|nr:protein of unknown function [Paenibacillus alvei]